MAGELTRTHMTVVARHRRRATTHHHHTHIF
nr:MAG TPA: ribosomal protein S6 [Caudoviricetes sp.]